MAAEHMRTWKIGDVEITRIVELWNHTDPLNFLLPEGSPELMKKYDWLFPHFATPDGDMMLNFQCFTVKTPERKIMVDTCVGNDRWREYDVFVNMHTSFIEDITAAGCPPDEITDVLCTHLHFDHVGWNTRKDGENWVPTFPNARYLFSKKEWAQWKDVPRDGTVHAQHLVDSVQPVLDAGLVDLVEPDHRICDEVVLFPTPGHTPGHVSVHISSNGKAAVITGDLLHHPVQIAEPDMAGNFDMDPKQGCDTRRQFLESYKDRKAFVIGSHFSDPTGGWIVTENRNWRFEADE